MKILVADDDPTTRTILQTALARLGYQTECVADGDQAWAKLQQRQGPEMAILDWHMPGMTGIEICRKLRQRQDVPYVYIMLLTGNNTTDDVVEGMAAGADEYIVKPVDAATLHARIAGGQRILELQRERAALKAQIGSTTKR